ncbi:MAG TPA: PAS domain S-box protein, partial [Rhodanobacteraceae bacterium]|nr:PAS domain S-box protein [Rhodanobacteraceae bacterium]
YFDRPFQPSPRDLRVLDILAQQVLPHLQRAHLAAELRDSINFNCALLESSPDCVKVLDLQGRVISMNTQGRRLLEIDPGEPLEGRHWRELLGTDCRAAVDGAVAEAAAGRAHSFEAFSPTTKGMPRWWECSVGPIVGADGQPERLLVISRDVTARKRAEEENQAALARERDARRAAEGLLRRDAWLTAIVKSTHDAIISKDLHGVIQSWNRGAEEMFGFSAEEAVGQPITILIPPDRLDEETRILERLGRGETVDTFETVRRRKDGEPMDVALTIAPILDAQGRVVGASKIARDITARKRVERAEQEIRRRFGALLDASSDTLYEASADWRAVRSLRSRDFHAGDAASNPDWMEGYIPAGERQRVREEIQAAILDRRMFEMEHRVLRADGSEGWVLARAAPVLDESGEIVEWFGTATDITARKRREEQLALLADIDEAVGRCESESAIVQAMSQRIGAYLNLHCCCLLGVDEQQDAVWVDQVWYAGEVPALPPRAVLSDFVGSAFNEQVRAGETVVVQDAFADALTDGAAYARYEVASFVTVPWHQEGTWRGLLAFCDDRPREWRQAEIDIVREIADRVLPRILRARAEERVRQSEARYRSLVDQVVSGIAETGLDGGFRTVNDQYCRMLGYTREELLQMRMQDITHPDDLQRNIDLFDRCVRQGHAFDIEKRNVRKDGTTIWVHDSVSAVCDARGRPQSLAAVSIDISESKHAEAELLASLQRETAARKEAEVLVEASRMLSSGLEFDELVQKMTDLATHLIGAEYGSFFYNVTGHAGESYMLYTLSGANRADFERMPMPRNTPLFQPTFAGTKTVRCGDVREHPDFGKEAPYGGLPEGHLPVTSYLAVPVLSRNGKVHGGLFFAHSQRDRFDARAERLVQGIAAQAATALDNVEAYHEVAASETHLRQILDAMPSAVYTTDAQGRLTYFNPAAVEFAGRTPQLGSDEWCVSWKLYNPDGSPLPHEQCPMARALKENRAISGMEAIAERPDGTRRWFTPFPTPLHDEQGKLVGGVNMLVDISGRKATELALRQSEERYRSLVSLMPSAVYTC